MSHRPFQFVASILSATFLIASVGCPDPKSATVDSCDDFCNHNDAVQMCILSGGDIDCGIDTYGEEREREWGSGEIDWAKKIFNISLPSSDKTEGDVFCEMDASDCELTDCQIEYFTCLEYDDFAADCETVLEDCKESELFTECMSGREACIDDAARAYRCCTHTDSVDDECAGDPDWTVEECSSILESSEETCYETYQCEDLLDAQAVSLEPGTGQQFENPFAAQEGDKPAIVTEIDRRIVVSRVGMSENFSDPLYFRKLHGFTRTADEEGNANGVRIWRVPARSDAAKLGLKPMDQIKRVNGVAITGVLSALEAFYQIEDADSLRVVVIRNGERLVLKAAVRGEKQSTTRIADGFYKLK